MRAVRVPLWARVVSARLLPPAPRPGPAKGEQLLKTGRDSADIRVARTWASGHRLDVRGVRATTRGPPKAAR